MENEFLLYSIYIAFIQLRERAYENQDEQSIKLCNLMHNIPLALINKTSKEVYDRFLERIEENGRQRWLRNRETEFYDRYPQHRKDS